MSLFQEILTLAVKHQISAEIRSLPDLCQSLDNLDVSISGDFEVGCKTPDQCRDELIILQTYVSLLITLISLFQEILRLAVKHQISVEMS